MSINRLLIVTAYAAFAVATAVSLAVSLFGYPSLTAAIFSAMLVGGSALFFLAKDIEKIFCGKGNKFFQIKYIFRLACFAVLLYLLLVRFRLNPFGVVAGLMLPMFCMAAVLFYISHKEQLHQRE
jgi:hypothetical protein